MAVIFNKVVATRLSFGGIFNCHFIANVLFQCSSETNDNLSTFDGIMTKTWWLTFWTTLYSGSCGSFVANTTLKIPILTVFGVYTHRPFTTSSMANLEVQCFQEVL